MVEERVIESVLVEVLNPGPEIAGVFVEECAEVGPLTNVSAELALGCGVTKVIEGLTDLKQVLAVCSR
mgnify:CR=1 FL=1